MSDEDASTPFLLTMPMTSVGDSFSIVMKSTDTLKLMQPEIFSCVKGHKIRGFEVKWCPTCYEEWLGAAFPMTKDPT
jgi:hypothetical protein